MSLTALIQHHFPTSITLYFIQEGAFYQFPDKMVSIQVFINN